MYAAGADDNRHGSVMDRCSSAGIFWIWNIFPADFSRMVRWEIVLIRVAVGLRSNYRNPPFLT